MPAMRQHTGGSVRDRLRRLAEFLPLFEDPSFEFGEWEPSRRTDSGAYTMPYYVFSPAAESFLKAAVALPGFDWPTWKNTEEARLLLTEHSRIAEARPEQLLKLLTVLVRADRFGEGTLAHAHESGLLRAIVRRASVLVADAPAG
jgi:hypothetical protein